MTAFKIGSVYRSQCGGVFKLSATSPYTGTEAKDGFGFALYGKAWDGCRCRTNLATGISDTGDTVLLPGELELKDGSWVPVARGVEEKEEGMTADEVLADLLRELDANMPMDSRDSMGVPALTWADTKPVDRWDGFTVYSETTEHPSHSHPTQKMQEGRNPANGSAALLKVR